MKRYLLELEAEHSLTAKKASGYKDAFFAFLFLVPNCHRFIIGITIWNRMDPLGLCFPRIIIIYHWCIA